MNIDEIYISISQNIVDSIDSPWSSATLNVERAGADAIGFKGGYIENGEFKSFKFRNFDRRSLTNDFHSLYEIMTHGNSNRWNKADFSLQSNGKFDVQFSWDQDIDQS